MEVLTRKLEDTHDEIQRVRCEVTEALKAFYGGASSLSADEALAIAARWSTPAQHAVLQHHTGASGAGKSAASEMDERMDRLARALQDVVGQLQLDDTSGSGSGSGSAPARLISSFAQRERLKRQMDQSRRMLQVVERVTHLDNELFDLDARMDKGDIVGAAEASVRAQSLFSGLQEASASGVSASDSDDVVHVLHLQLLKKRNRLVHTLEQAHKRMISTRPTAVRVKKPSFHLSAASPGVSSAEAFRMLWGASDLMEMLPARLQELAKTVSTHLLKPLFASDQAFVKTSEEADGVSMTIASSNDSPKRSEADGIAQKISQLIAVLRFVHAEMLAGEAEIMRQVAEYLWKAPGNLESQLLTLLQDKIPKDTSAINAYRDAITRVIHDLSESTEALGFVIPRNSQVRNFGDQINLLYAKKRRQQLMTIARGFMSRDYRNSVKVTAATERCNIDASLGSGKKDGSSGKGKLGAGGSGGGSSAGASSGDEVESGSFQMPDYRITHCAHDVVELAHQTLMEACTPDAVYANTFFHTSRDILFLFRAVVPTLYASEIANDASTCMLFHNDCMYIAYHMLTIGHLYKNRLPPPLTVIATMVDMVPAFREAGENALTTYAKTVSDDLRSGIRVFQERGGVESTAALDDLEQFLKTTLYKLNHMTTAWREGLPQAVHNRVMGFILQPLVTSFLEQMLMDKKIGSSATGKLHTLASLLLETQASFASAAQAEKHVPELVKLRRYASLLVQPLETIQDQFLNGDLSDFSSQELSAVVRSLFRESPERKELLRLVSTAPTASAH